MKVENIVMVAVGVLLLAAVLVPVINSVQYEYEAAENEDADQLYSLTDELTITVASSKITINGDEMTVSGLTYLVVAEDFFITATNNTSVSIYSNDGVLTSLNYVYYTNNQLITTDTSDQDGHLDVAATSWYVVDAEGTYGIWNHGSDVVNVNDTTDVVLLGTTTLTGGESASESVSYIFNGKLKGTFAPTMAITSGNDEVTAASVVIPTAQVTTDTDLSLKFSSGTVTVNATVDGVALTGTATVMVFIPVEYMASTPIDNQYGQILGIVPIMVAVGLIIACVSEFIARKN